MMKLLGLGDNVIDCYLNEHVLCPGGNAVNVAAHGALLGQESAYLGNFGDDVYAEIIREGLSYAGAGYGDCPVIPGSSTKLCRYNIINGERQFIDVVQGENWSGPLAITPAVLKKLAEYELIHSCCNAKMENEWHLLASLPAILTYDFSVKEKYRTPEYLHKICPHLDLALFSCSGYTRQQLLHFAAAVCQAGALHVLITAGDDGQFFFNGRYAIWNPAERIAAKDTMGAGDAFLTAFVCELYRQGWRKGLIMDEQAVRPALQKAAAYASANCMKDGGFGFRAAGRII